MAAFSTIIAAAGLGLGAVGTGFQIMGQQEAQKGAKRAEQLREAQMTIENTRQRRSLIRQATVARAAATSNATAQGASESSGLAGGLAQISGESGSAITAGNQNLGLGQGMFAANRQISSGQTTASIGSGLSSFGGGLVQNSQMIGRIGQYFAGQPT